MNRKKNLFGIISFFISIAILAYFIFITNGIQELKDSIKDINMFWIMVAVMCMIMYWLLESLTLFVITKRLNSKYTFKKAIDASTIGLYYSALTPFASGGQPLQLYTMVKSGVKGANAGAVLVIKSVVFQIMLTLYAIIFIIRYFSFFDSRIKYFAQASIIGILVNLIIIIVVLTIMLKKDFTKNIVRFFINLLSKMKIVKNSEELILKANIQIDSFSDSGRKYKYEKKTIILSFIITFFQFTFYYLITYFIILAFGINNHSFVIFLAAQSIVTMISSFTPLPGGSGAAEAIFYILFKELSLPSIGLILVIWRFITYYILIIFGGVASLFFIKKDKKDEK